MMIRFDILSFRPPFNLTIFRSYDKGNGKTLAEDKYKVIYCYTR